MIEKPPLSPNSRPRPDRVRRARSAACAARKNGWRGHGQPRFLDSPEALILTFGGALALKVRLKKPRTLKAGQGGTKAARKKAGAASAASAPRRSLEGRRRSAGSGVQERSAPGGPGISSAETSAGDASSHGGESSGFTSRDRTSDHAIHRLFMPAPAATGLPSGLAAGRGPITINVTALAWTKACVMSALQPMQSARNLHALFT